MVGAGHAGWSKLDAYLVHLILKQISVDSESPNHTGKVPHCPTASRTTSSMGCVSVADILSGAASEKEQDMYQKYTL